MAINLTIRCKLTDLFDWFFYDGLRKISYCMGSPIQADVIVEMHFAIHFLETDKLYHIVILKDLRTIDRELLWPPSNTPGTPTRNTPGATMSLNQSPRSTLSGSMWASP